MLHLGSRTAPDWAAYAVQNIDEILVDHAHLEKKAASTAITLLFRYPEQAALLRPLSALAREELEHFELVLSLLEERNRAFTRMKPCVYAGKLMEVLSPAEPDRLIDTLICCAFIEARSCERMKLLAEALPSGPVRDLYAGLLASEARHHRLYLDLAQAIADRDAVRRRVEEISTHEAEVMRTSPRVPRLHSA
ncbi:MAG: tRNA-(ms[2]io[6]A)-hydroxylase [Myxococcales bacterium]|nr:tRNA-(ms[2]io[6]A)-hydroxylase [Myxococcales bacterium]